MERRQHVIIGRNLQQKIFPKIALFRKCALFPEKYIAMIGEFQVPLLTEKKNSDICVDGGEFIVD